MCYTVLDMRAQYLTALSTTHCSYYVRTIKKLVCAAAVCQRFPLRHYTESDTLWCHASPLYTAPRNECTHDEIRLANGPSAYEGRIELCLHGTWSGLCADYSLRFDSRDAAVACQQLGYHGLGKLCIPVIFMGYNFREILEGTLKCFYFVTRIIQQYIHVNEIFVGFKVVKVTVRKCEFKSQLTEECDYIVYSLEPMIGSSHNNTIYLCNHH